ncbi:MAG: DUF2339 domain-containing protein [bacterium]|nr:DUF2339 domain-containing protein [bacterium]
MEIFLIVLVLALLFYNNAVLKGKLENIYNKVWTLETKLHEQKELDRIYNKVHFLETKLDELSNKIINGVAIHASSNKEQLDQPAIVLKNIEKPLDLAAPIELPMVDLAAPKLTEVELLVEEKIRPMFSTFETIRSFEMSSIELEDSDETNSSLSETLPENYLVQESKNSSERPMEKLEVEKSNWYDSFIKNNPDIERFIGENLISKIGIAILVLGIAFFVQFAIDNNWINETARAGVGILAGGIVLGFAHKLRANYKAFSSVLVAGGISIFYFTLAIAFQQYHLFSQTLAFTFMAVVTCFSVYISLAYDRQELAILSLIGGVASPIMVSTGEGNYQVLFTYLLLLDLSILILAYFRNWHLLNILTFVFTLIIYGGWLNQKVFNGDLNAPYLGALLFGSAFYFVFMLSNLINQIKEKRPFKTIELSLILSNTFLFFSVGISILNLYNPNYKGLFTILLALFNLVIAYLVNKNYSVDKNLFYLLIGLTLTFITLAAPIQLDGNYITLFWAAEASLLLWLAQKSKLEVYRFVSILIAALSVVSLAMDWGQIYPIEIGLTPILNRAFLSAAFVVGSFIFYARSLQSDTNSVFNFYGLIWKNESIQKAIYCILIPLIYLMGFLELRYHVNNAIPYYYQVNVCMLTYHLFFSSILFLSVKRFKQAILYNSIQFGGMLNLLLFLIFFSAQYKNEITYIIGQGGGLSLAYWLHLLAMIPFVHQMVLLYQSNKKKHAELSAWVLMIALCILASTELIWLRLQFSLPQLIEMGFSEANYSVIGIMERTVVKSGFPILWGCLAFILLIQGIRRRRKPLRIAALTLIGITILKLFLYDIQNVSKGGKIGAFIALGIVLLIISFTYQKIKTIILDEDAHEEAVNEEA